MYNNIKVNVVGPMKSGKSQVVRIIEEATAEMGIVVTEQNVQDEPTAESGFTKPADAAFENPAGGGSAPSSCSAGTGVSDKQFDWENAIKNIATDSSKQTVDPLSVGLAQPMPPQLVTDDHILSVEGSRYVPSPQ